MAVVPHVLLQSDADQQETQEWLEALDAVVAHEGPDRARYLIERLTKICAMVVWSFRYSANTPYLNTISTADQPNYPGDPELELRIQAYLRCHCHGGACQQAHQCGWPYRVLCLQRDPVRRGFQLVLEGAYK